MNETRTSLSWHAAWRLLAVGSLGALVGACGGGGGSAAPQPTAAPTAPAPTSPPPPPPPPAPAPPAFSCQGWCWPLNSGNTAQQFLLADFAADGLTGMAITFDRQLLRSRDGGLIWQLLPAAPVPAVSAIGTGLRMASASVAFWWGSATGVCPDTSGQSMWRTEDAGDSWKLLSCMAPSERGHAWWMAPGRAAGVPWVLNAQTAAVPSGTAGAWQSAITRDAGVSWRVLPFLTTLDSGDGVLLGEKPLVAGGSEFALWRSDDFGVTSRVVQLGQTTAPVMLSTQLNLSGFGSGNDLYFAVDAETLLNQYGLMSDNPRRVWLRDRDKSQLMVSSDSGADWSTYRWNLSADLRAAAMTVTHFASDGKGWAEFLNDKTFRRIPSGLEFVKGRRLMLTDDFGQQWRAFTPPAPFDANQVVRSGLGDARSPWFLLATGERRVSTDAGLTWQVGPSAMQVTADAALRRSPSGHGWLASRSWNFEAPKLFEPGIDLHDYVQAYATGPTSAWRLTPGYGGVPSDVRRIAFFDGHKGLALLADNTLLATQDGGAHWVRRTVAPAPPAMHACGPNCGGTNDGLLQLQADSSGWLLLREQLMRSTDTGQTWAVQSLPGAPTDRVLAIGRLDSRLGWAQTLPLCVVGNDRPECSRQLHFTTDGGQTWVSRSLPVLRSDVPYASPESAWGALPAAFSSSTSGVAAFGTNLLHFTSDGGASWVPASVSGVPGYVGLSLLPKTPVVRVLSLGFVDSQRGWALAEYLSNHSDLLGLPQPRAVLRTMDAGRSWLMVHSSEDSAVAGLANVRPMVLSFADADRGFALHRIGNMLGDVAYHVATTNDGGRTWSALPTSPWALATLHAQDAQRVWVGGQRGALAGTTSGGR